MMTGYHRSLCWVALNLALTVTLAAHAQPAAPKPVTESRVEEHIGAQLPLQTTFTSSRGRPVKLGKLLGAGRPALLVLAYNRCSMLCNLVLRGVADLVRASSRKLGADYSVVTLSIDPRETPDEAARTQQSVIERAGYSGQPERWPFLVGSKRNIARVASAVGFRYAWDPRTKQFAHPAVVFAIDEHGRVESYLYGLRHDPERVEELVAGTMTPAKSSVTASVLSCFHFDALGRKYGPWVQRLFQMGAVGILAALCLTVVGLWRRERRRRVEEAS